MKTERQDGRRTLRQLIEKLSRRSAHSRRHAPALSRRDFLQMSATAGAGASLAGTLALRPTAHAAPGTGRDTGPSRFNEATIAQLQAEMANGRVSSVELTTFYLNRINQLDQNGPGLNAVLELNPDALAIAQAADAMRRSGRVLGPLHGIPILLKDNIDTGDRMQTTAGSFALAGQPAVRDSTVAAKLRAGGAVILGKTNLSEWANFRSFFSSSGWSGRGGQTGNPYAIDRNPCGSSSGSGAAASANFVSVSLGTETDGSIVCPATINGVVGIKPTVGLVSRAGVVPISHTQDTVGPHARTVADAAAVLSVIASQTFDGRDAATGGVPLGWRGGPKSRPTLPTDYTQFLDANGLAGARIGITRQGVDDASPAVGRVFDQAIAAMTAAGATLVDLDAEGFTFPSADGEFLVLCYDFKIDLQNYFATRVGVPMAGKTLADAIAFNIAHASTEMPYFGQEIFELTQLVDTSSPDAPQPVFGGLTYNQALDIDQAAGVNGIDLAIAQFGLDAIATPTGTASWTTDVINGDHFQFATSGLAAAPGYPIINVPMGNILGLPVGISFMNTAFSEDILIRIASGFEAATAARIVPQLPATLPLQNVSGVPLSRRQSAPGRNRPRFM